MTFMEAEMSWFASSWLAQEKLSSIAVVLKAQNRFITFGELEINTLFSYDCVQSMIDEWTSRHLYENKIILGKPLTRLDTMY